MLAKIPDCRCTETRPITHMPRNINETRVSTIFVFWAFALIAILGLQSCAVPVIYYDDDTSGVDFAAVVATFPEYENVPLPHEIIPLTQKTISIETKRLRTTALSSPKPASATDSRYHVGTSDILYIVVWDHPELSNVNTNSKDVSEELRGSVVSTEGNIYYPYIGSVNVAGLTVDQIRTKLTKLLSATIEKPQLEVRVSEYRSQKAFVGGEVLNPGMQKISDIPLTLIDAINNAGGATEMADLSKASLTRHGKLYKLNLSELLVTGNKALNVDLLDGDIFSIPSVLESKFYVLGDVANPVHEKMSTINKKLSEVISDAGGAKRINEESIRSSVQYFVLRSTENGTLIFHLDQKAADSLIVSNSFEVIADDIVFVSSANRSSWNLVYQQLIQYANRLDEIKAM